MLYEIMNHIKFKGQINSYDIIEILGKFKDINTKENLERVSDQEYAKYSKFGIEAV